MNDYLRSLSIGNPFAAQWVPMNPATPSHGSWQYGAMPYDINAYNTWANQLQTSLNPNFNPNVYDLEGGTQWVGGQDSWAKAPQAVFNPSAALSQGRPINMELLKGWMRDRHPTMDESMINLRSQFRALRPIFGANIRAGVVPPGTNLMRDIVLGGRSWADATGAGGGGSQAMSAPSNTRNEMRIGRARRR